MQPTPDGLPALASSREQGPMFAARHDCAARSFGPPALAHSAAHGLDGRAPLDRFSAGEHAPCRGANPSDSAAIRESAGAARRLHMRPGAVQRPGRHAAPLGRHDAQRRAGP